MICWRRTTKKETMVVFGSKCLKPNCVRYSRMSSRRLLKSFRRLIAIDCGRSRFILLELTMQRRKFNVRFAKNSQSRSCNFTRSSTRSSRRMTKQQGSKKLYYKLEFEKRTLFSFKLNQIRTNIELMKMSDIFNNMYFSIFVVILNFCPEFG